MSGLTWLIGGPQGSGVESGANIFASACASAGYEVYGRREFYSNIKGEHSYFAVRVSDSRIRSNVSGADLVASFDAETVFRHYAEAGSGIIYDPGLSDVRARSVPTLDAPFLGRLESALGPDPTVSSALHAAEAAGARLHPVPFRSVLEEISAESGEPRLRGMVRMNNVLGVSVSLGMLGMGLDMLLDAVGATFGKKRAAAELAAVAARHAHARAKKWDGPALGAVRDAPGRILAQGHHGVSLGKMAAGCRFQSYYPITPASDESVHLETHEILDVIHGRPGSTAVVQTEDEISAIGMAIGASLAGTRSATSTSGPGFSLMAEALGWAGINEVPLVITIYQRSGPSTGLPTRHGQDDLMGAVFSGHGEFPRIVYASGGVEESFYDTARCFNYADVFQVPVIHMMDKLISSSVSTCPRFDPGAMTIDRGKLLDRIGGRYRRFEAAPDGISPRSHLGLPGGIFWNTGDESDEEGHITEDPVLRRAMMDKRMSRLDRILERVPPEEQAVSYGAGGCAILTWGSAVGPVLDAVDMVGPEKFRVVQAKLLWPFPAERVRGLLEGAGTIIDVEANHTGQLGMLLRQCTGIEPDYHVVKYTGRGMTCTEVAGALEKVLSGAAARREVLYYGA